MTAPPEQLPNLPPPKEWKVIYPVCINSRKSVSEGRRLACAKCVENPTFMEVAEACHSLGLPVIVEPHASYPRDFTQRGRIRVCLKSDQGRPLVPELRSFSALLVRVCQVVPSLSSRTARPSDSSSTSSSRKQQRRR